MIPANKSAVTARKEAMAKISRRSMNLISGGICGFREVDRSIIL
jgi:hypothetical protein